MVLKKDVAVGLICMTVGYICEQSGDFLTGDALLYNNAVRKMACGMAAACAFHAGVRYTGVALKGGGRMLQKFGRRQLPLPPVE